jgi:hypothetical protein
MKKLLILMIALTVVVSFTGIALAKKEPAKPKPTTETISDPAKGETAAGETAPATAKKAPAKMRQFTGIVSAVDVVANTITLDKAKTSETFGVDAATKIKLRKDYKLGEIPKGTKAMVTFKEEAGKKIAVNIQLQKLPKTEKKAEPKTAAPAQK